MQSDWLSVPIAEVRTMDASGFTVMVPVAVAEAQVPVAVTV